MFLNHVTLIGRIGKITSRSMERGSIVDINLAVDRSYKDDDGRRPTDWIRVQTFGPLATAVEKYGKVGRLVAVEGALRTSQFNKEVEVEGYDDLVIQIPTISVSVHADTVRFLDSVQPGDTQETSGNQIKGRVIKSRNRRARTAKATGTDDVPF